MGHWVHPLTIVGAAAEGENYFQRPKVEKKLWREIQKGNHLRFSAPRRVGKSSVMKYMAKSPVSGYVCRYENISSDASSHDFYKRLFEMAICQISKSKKHFQKLSAWVESLGDYIKGQRTFSGLG